MPANPSVIGDIEDILIEDVHPRLESQVFKKNITLEHFEKGRGMIPMQNNTFLIKVEAYEHSGVYFQAHTATADLNFGAPTYDELTVTAAAGYGSHRITDFTLTAAKGKPAAIVDLATDFGRSVQAQLRRSMNRQFLGIGGTTANNAKIADVNGASSATTVTLDGFGTRFIMPDALLDIGTDAEHGAGTADEVRVSTVNSSTAITISASATVADNDLVKFANADDNEMIGLGNVVSATADVYGVTRSTNYYSQAFVDSTSEALTESDMIDALIEADKVGDVNVVLTNGTLYSKYASLLVSLKRAAQRETLTGGFVGLEFAAGKPGVGVFLDHDVIAGEMYFLTTPSLSIGKLDMGWLDQGAGIFQRVNLRPAWWATYKFYGNLGCLQFRANSVLRGKTV